MKLNFLRDSLGPAATALLLCLMVVRAEARAGAIHETPSLKAAKSSPVEFSVGGRTYKKFEWVFPRRDENDDDMSFVAVEAPPGSFELDVKEVRQDGDVADMLKNVTCENAIALTNGGFYFQGDDGARHVSGLVVSNGAMKSPIARRKFGGFITWDGHVLSVRRLQEGASAKKAREALQSSPISIWNEKLDRVSDDDVLFDRSAVGVTTSGGLVLAGTFKESGDAASMSSFARMLKEMASVGGPRLKSILNLDGGPSAHLYIPALKQNYGFSGMNFLPNALCARAR